MSAVISARNVKLLAPTINTVEKRATARKKAHAPVRARAFRKDLFKKQQTQDTYIGLTSYCFKKRLYSQNLSFKNPDVNQTSLSNDVRKLQQKRI